MKRLRVRYWAYVLLTPVALTGCTPTPVPVTGSVTINGKPMDHGGVDFIPIDPAAKKIRVGGSVTNGVYAIDADRGPLPGKYRVEVSWMKSTGKKMSAGDDGSYEARVEGLPAKFNEKSELTAEVTSGANQIDFNLTP